MQLPKGVHRVKRKLVGGKVRWHFYAWRGGPKFWEDDNRVPRDPDFFVAFADYSERPKPSKLMTPALVDEFLSSTAMPPAKRSKADIRKWALLFADHFKDAPACIFEERGSRGEVNRWRAKWKHSPKQHDASGTHAVRVLNWAVEEGKLSEHHCHKLRQIYTSDRSEIVWSPADREMVDAIAPEWVRRILCVACETGLRPGDLIRITTGHVENTPNGRRLRARTNKRGRLAHIPITPALAKVIDETPNDRLLILTNATGGQLTEHRASEGLREWRNKANVPTAEDGRPKSLSDTRGTAATMLLNVGLTLAEIANHMGWSIRYAASVIEHYARVSPDQTDAVLVKLAQAKGGAS